MVKAMTFMVKKIASPSRVSVRLADACLAPLLAMASASRQPKQQ